MPLTFGNDASGYGHPLLVDADGRVIVAGNNISGVPVPILTDTLGRTVIAGQYPVGLDGPIKVDASGRMYVAIKGDDKIFSFDSTARQRISTGALPAGTSSYPSVWAIAGSVAVITNVHMLYTGVATPAYVYFYGIIGGQTVIFATLKPSTSGHGIALQGQWIFNSGDTIGVIVNGATAGDTVLFDYAGYYMGVP
jgi:hypothetical protein